ncbi:MAG: hypothetical protein ABSD73_02365 [Candidatus Bathyarchaeia archaeon]
MIKLRIDVDYPFPSRLRSFLYVAFGIRTSAEYLKNSKIIAGMINESPEDIEAHWFFTPKTIPDAQLLALLNNVKHAVELHVVNDPYKEMGNLEKATGRRANYYTIHGTARLLARIMWKRWKSREPEIPKNFRLKSFHQFLTRGLDGICYRHTTEEAVEIARNYIAKGYVLYFHPIWLFQRGTINQRSAFYQALKTILRVDGDLESVTFSRKIFFTMANDAREYVTDIVPMGKFLEKLRERGADVFNFLERKWCSTVSNVPKSWAKTDDNVALLQITTYDEWWENIGKKTRNMVRKAEKSGVKAQAVAPDDKLAEGIWKIYNETPIRQERAFPVYGISLQAVKRYVLSLQNCTYIGAYLQDELVGFIRLFHGRNVTMLSQILALQKHRDLAVNNVLIAKTVEVCASKGEKWLMYARMGNHPTLDRFKQSNGFTRFPLVRYYVPLTRTGETAVKLGLHKRIEDELPASIKYRLIPIYNWISRIKMKIRLRFKPKPES